MAFYMHFALRMSLKRTTHTTIDYYSKHLFLKVISYVLCPPDTEEEDEDQDAENPRTSFGRMTSAFRRRKSSRPRRKSDLAQAESAVSANNDQGRPVGLDGNYPSSTARSREKALDKVGEKLHIASAASRAVQALTEEYRVKINTDSMSIFLLRDGTLISIMRNSRDLLEPIYQRLSTQDTILREREDASMLLQALLDIS